MLAVVAPGQGAQKPGMLIPWLDLDGLPARLAELARGSGLDLARLGTTANADEIRDTAVTQPLVVATSLLAAGRLDIPAAALTAGHSVGELAAAAVAGVLTDRDAVGVAALRGSAMGRACALVPTSMAAAMNADTELVLRELERRDLVGANVNGAGQVVAAGSAQSIADLAANPPEGIRVIPLSVAGAFHTDYMRPARDELAPHLAGLLPGDPTRPLLTNSDGRVVASGREYLDLLLGQIIRPVRWDRCMDTMAAVGVTGILELPPAGTLVGLAKRQLKGVATMACKSPDDLDAAQAFIVEHAGVTA